MADALFSLNGSEGVIKRTASGAYKLLIGGLEKAHTWFTNRPGRLQGTLSSRELVDGWNTFFGDDPPNSALSYRDRDGSHKSFVFEQFNPKLIKNGTVLASKIEFLPSTAADSYAPKSLSKSLDRDPLTGFKLKRGGKAQIKDPSVVIDDFQLSQVTFVNNTSHDMRIDYVIGVPGTSKQLLSRDLNRGTTATLAGTTHDSWDLTALVKVFDVTSWKTGVIVQAENPWNDDPRFELNQTGASYIPSEFLPGATGFTRDPRPGEGWQLQKPSIGFRFANDDALNDFTRPDWTIEFYQPS